MYRKILVVIFIIILLFIISHNYYTTHNNYVSVVSPLHATESAVKLENTNKNDLMRILKSLPNETQEQELVIGLPYKVTIQDGSSKTIYYINSNHIRKVEIFSETDKDITWYLNDSRTFKEIRSIIKSSYQTIEN